jgi:uncharacterized membrane protein YkoI
MIKLTLAAALAASLATAAVADNGKVEQAGMVSAAQVTQALQAQGYAVNKIQFDDGKYEVKATKPGQQKTKLEISAATGQVLSSKLDD